MQKQADVLIIGGGLAGLMAALSARRYTPNVVLVSKAPAGRSGNTLVSGGGIAAATDTDTNNAQVFFNDIVQSGKGLANLTLAKKLAVASNAMLGFLENFGVKFVRQNDGYKARRPPGHSVPRNIPTDWSGLSYLNRGLSFTLPLLGHAAAAGVTLIEGVRITRLVKQDEQITGAIGFDRTGNPYYFPAASVILATGGAGYIYACTNNTRDIAGEGLAMALEAGCVLQDLEQVQFYPTMMFHPLKVPISNPLFGAGAVLRNRHGERFMQNYDRDGDMATRDSMARGIYLEIRAGRGLDNSVFFDCTQIPEEKIKNLFPEFYQFLMKLGLNPSRQYLKVSPCVHYFLGGIRIDAYCQTGVPGLYAAGEICGGIQGANRLSGAALMEACVFGWQAGESAAQERLATPVPGRAAESIIPESIGGKESDLTSLRQIMWEYAALIRSEAGLKTALETILAIRQAATHDCRDAAELSRMAIISEAVVRSALLRRESRGAHYRSDYPLTDPAYDGNILCWQEGSNLKVRLAPIS